MSKIIHGTSLQKALELIKDPVLNKQNQNKLYFFESERPEAYAGALSFSTGNGLRGINNSFNLTFTDNYISLNPNFPLGLTGKILKLLLNKAVNEWQKKQEQLNTEEYDSVAAIVECEKIDELISVNRKKIVFESYVEKNCFEKIKVSAIYVDQMHTEDVKLFLKKINSTVEVKKIETLIEKIK